MIQENDILNEQQGADPESLNEFDNMIAGTASAGKKRDVALVYDRYYEKAPKTLPMLIAKTLFIGALCACSMLFVLTNLDMPIDLARAGLICFFCAAGLSALFLFVRRSIAIPVAVLVCSAVVWHNRSAFWDRFTWFLDAMLLQMHGRLLQTADMVSHNVLIAADGDSVITAAYAEELVFGLTLALVLYSLIVAASMSGRPHILPVAVVFIAMWVPRMIAERLLFNWWLIPTAALFAGGIAMTLSHKGGLAIRQGYSRSYRGAASRNERLFNLRTENTAYFRRVSLRGAYNSKYFALAICSTALFLAAILLANAIAGSSKGIDYTGLYERIKELGSGRGGVSSPFKTGPVSEYFTAPDSFKQGSGLSITSPGNGEQEIMRVKNSGPYPVYLRGDVGMDFDGKSWSSPVDGEPDAWLSSGLDGTFRPLELPTLYAYEGGYNDENIYIWQSELSVDYLCDTNVVFVPAYTDYYESYLDAEKFTVYGDFAVRLTDKAAKLGSMRGYVYTPTYMGVEEIEHYDALSAANAAKLAAAYSYTLSEYYGSEGSYSKTYARYVRDTYLNVPESYMQPISDYIAKNLSTLTGVSWIYNYGVDNSTATYDAALSVSEYLRNNYAYSLSARFDRNDPVMSFLNETKSGHCALYASSMTLIMRSLGIPARYCTGFVAKPTEGAGEVLRSKNLHAWCEVYLDELGWVTFDPTSSVSVDAAVNGTSLPEESSSSSSSSESSSSVPESSSSSSSASTLSRPENSGALSDSEASSGESVNILPYLLTILAIAAGAALIAFVVYRVHAFNKNAKRALKRFYTAENPRAVYAKLLAVLRLCKLTPNGGELTADYFERSGKTLGCDLTAKTELLERLAFGSGKLSDAEKAALGRLFERLFAAADKKLGVIGKIRLRLIVLTKKRN
ncbi:MAG: transglutaminase-like domain-containing protein [Lachnospiraceae bacterium]|nr:transglutaminase-like domain-containing protein [Ruminococcus sp.]MCM1275731.1 transglutaminase-like domain-containing protein [Lachnospiraceae bacterium]